MPELPEVETIKRGLQSFIKKKKLNKICVHCEKCLVNAEGMEEVLGRRVLDLRRRGKALLIDFEGGWTMMVHLRMTGQLIWVPKAGKRFAGGHPSENFLAELPNKQTRVSLLFEEGTLYFNDQRKFGFIKLLLTNEVEEDAFIAGLGPEPWEMSVEELQKKLRRHGKSAIKAVLLDQKVMAGLGNIYADETCHFAGVRPERKCEDLTEGEIEQILQGARVTMERSIDSGGSTMATYRKADGTRGDYLEKFAEVFRREGQKCRRCGGEIMKTRVAGRGTHYCPGCQK